MRAENIDSAHELIKRLECDAAGAPRPVPDRDHAAAAPPTDIRKAAEPAAFWCGHADDPITQRLFCRRSRWGCPAGDAGRGRGS